MSELVSPQPREETTEPVQVLRLSGQWTAPAALLRSIWSARELIVILGRRNFYVQYRRASLGVLWAMGLPLMQAVVLALVFSKFTRFAVPHYPVYVFSGMVAWTFFLGTILPACTSIVDNAGLSSKVYFPRAVLPLSLVLASSYTLVTTGAVLLGFAAVLGVYPSLQTLLIIPAFGLVLALSSAFALLLSVLHVYLRDTRHIMQAASLAWFWVTPVAYPIDSIQGWLHQVILINPVTGVVQLFHGAFVDGIGSYTAVWSSVAWTAALLAAAAVAHCRQDRVLADLL